MRIFFAETPSKKQQREIDEIIAQCRQSDGIRLSCPPDAALYVLAELPGGGDPGRELHPARIAAVLAACPAEEEVLECYAFTRPALRRQGYFSALLEAACQETGPLAEYSLRFVTDGRCPAALLALKAAGAEPEGSEYMMELTLSSAICMQDANAQCRPAEFPAVPDAASADSTDLLVPILWNSREAGSCRLSFHRRQVYLYALSIHPELRRQGIASAFLAALKRQLADKSFHTLRLQVSGSNFPALALYQKAGFSVVETLHYFLY